MNTWVRLARTAAGAAMLGLVGCDGPGLLKYYARRDVEAHFVAMEERGDVAMTTDCDGYMDAALEHKMPSWRLAPPATVGDALEFFEVCALNCLCKNGHDGKGRIKVVVCVGKELLERPVPYMRAEQIAVRDALRLLCESVGFSFKVDPEKRTITIADLVCGGHGEFGPRCDETFRYMCTSQVGPVACGATNIVDAIKALYAEGNESLSSNGCPHGISVVYHPEGEEDRTTADSVTLPPCPIHDACMMVAHHYNLSYFYQNGLIKFSDMPEVGKAGGRCDRCEYGLCGSAEIGPFHFDCDSMDDIVREVCVSGNRQLRENGHSGFFVAQLVCEGPIREGRTVQVEKGLVRNVLLQVAQAMGLKVAYDAGCFYLYKNDSDIRGLARPLLLVPAQNMPE